MAWFTVEVSLDAPTMTLLNGMAASFSSIAKSLAAVQTNGEVKVAIDLSAITSAVAAVEKAVNDGVTEITALVSQMANTVDPAALAALQARLTTAATNMETAVTNAATPPT